MPNVPSDYNLFYKNISVSGRYKMSIFIAVTSYLTPLGWVVALLIHDKHQSMLSCFHLRQSLGLIITGALLSLIPLVGWLLSIGVLCAWFVGVYSAITGQFCKVPILGELYQKQLYFIK
jgi:uncharacterized membrane protein